MEDSNPGKANRDDLPWFPGQNLPQTTYDKASAGRESRALEREHRRIADSIGAWTVRFRAFHEAKGWAALSYFSVEAYALERFGMPHTTTFRMLNQAEVAGAIAEVLGLPPASLIDPPKRPSGVPRRGTSPAVSQRAAAVLKPDLPAVVEEVAEAVSEGADPAQAVVDAVARRTAKPPPILLNEHSAGPTIDPETGEILTPARIVPLNSAKSAAKFLTMLSPEDGVAQLGRTLAAELSHWCRTVIAHGKAPKETVSAPPPARSDRARGEVTTHFKGGTK